MKKPGRTIANLLVAGGFLVTFTTLYLAYGVWKGERSIVEDMTGEVA